MTFAIKAEIDDLRARTFDFPAQKTMYGGKTIAAGDTIFLFASENEGGPGLIARGVVTAARATPRKPGVERQTPRVSITVRRTALAKRRLGRAELRPFDDWKDGRPEIELNFKFYRQATNKIVGITPEATVFLGSFLLMPTIELLRAYADAWNRHDVETILDLMTEDCVFEASAGPDVCGARSAGREAVRAAFVDVWTTFPDAHWGGARHFVSGDRGVSEWTFTGTRADGSRVEVHGCDVFTFRDGRIAVKDSYRKNRPPLGASKG